MADLETSIFDFTVEDRFGKPCSLRDKFGASGKKCYLVVNVASKCGLTASNYSGLVELYEKLSPQGLEIIAFPCNNFGGQEPGDNDQVCEFAARRKAVFPIMGKIEAENGTKTHPLYTFLKSKLSGEVWGLLGTKIKWNFSESRGSPFFYFLVPLFSRCLLQLLIIPSLQPPSHKKQTNSQVSPGCRG